MTIIV
jgi:Ca-activated chloride channel homolog